MVRPPLKIPLHNNLSENNIREYVKRRKVSGSTRSEQGRQCRDTFTSLKKTCPKLGVSFWGYLLDRMSKGNEIPPLQELILHHANAPWWSTYILLLEKNLFGVGQFCLKG